MDQDLGFSFPKFDFRSVLATSVYFLALNYLGVVLWKAAVVAAIIMLCMIMHFGRQILLKGGIAAMFIGLIVWTDLLPPPKHWHAVIRNLFVEMVADKPLQNYSSTSKADMNVTPQ